MSNVNVYIQTFAGGEFGAAMSARVGIDAYQASCELAENWFTKAQGPLDRRPPLLYIASFEDSTKRGVLKSFEFDVGQNYLLLLTDEQINFYLNDGILDVPAVTATIANGTFSNFTGWTDNSESGASAFAADGFLNLQSNGVALSRARTTFTVNEANTDHVLRFEVENGPVNLRIGTTAGEGELFKAVELRRGLHQIEFFPTTTGTHHIQFWYEESEATKLVDNVSIVAAGSFSLVSPWPEIDMRGVFTAQDGDRLWMFHRNHAARLLERRGHLSWSLIYFEPDDGPFMPGLSSVTMASSSAGGDTVLTADTNYFIPGDVRRLVRITHPGQYVRQYVNDDGYFTDSIKVSGIAADRVFRIIVSGTFTGTVTLERSVGNENSFSKVITRGVSNALYNDSYPVSDAVASGGATDDGVYNSSHAGSDKGRLDNTTVFYRLAVYAGEWTSGTAALELSVNSGSQTGIARITQYSSPTQVQAEVLQLFSRTGASDVWDISAWCDDEEWPNVVAFAHGRLWAFRRRQIWSSVSDDYFSFQDGTVTDQSVQLTLRSRSAEGVRWARELDFLCVGTRNEEYVLRSTSPSEPIGPVTAEPTLQGEEGGALVEATIGGDSIIFVHRNNRRVMQFSHNPRALSEESFVSVDLTRLNPESCEDGIVSVVIQQEPERRIFAVLESGIVKPALFRREEEIMGWGTMTTQGFFEDAIVLREGAEDAVYFIVRRYINGAWVRMIERQRSELVLNAEDLVHLDSMLETPIVRPTVSILPSSIEMGAVTVTSADTAFSAPDVGKILWVNGGRILIGAFINSKTITGTVIYPLLGKLNYRTGEYEPALASSGRWGIAVLTSTVTGLEHLEGATVHVWADLAYQGTRVVSGGSVTLAAPASRIFVGLNFTSVWKSLKLAYGATKGTAINQPKKVTHMGLVLDRTADTILFGDTPGKLKKLVKQSQPSLLGGAARYFTGEAHETFEGAFDADPRIIIATENPGPATIKAIIPNVQINERA